jgi:hypothetical protein
VIGVHPSRKKKEKKKRILYEMKIVTMFILLDKNILMRVLKNRHHLEELLRVTSFDKIIN